MVRRRRKRKAQQPQQQQEQALEVREIAPNDVSWFLGVAERFWKDHSIGDLYGDYDPAGSAQIVEAVVESPQATIFVAHKGDARVGTLMLAVTPLLISKRAVAQEIVWWVDPEHMNNGAGWELFEAASSWAKEQGAKSIIAASPRGNPQMGQMFMKHGFRLSEALYLKGL